MPPIIMTNKRPNPPPLEDPKQPLIDIQDDLPTFSNQLCLFSTLHMCDNESDLFYRVEYNDMNVVTNNYINTAMHKRDKSNRKIYCYICVDHKYDLEQFYNLAVPIYDNEYNKIWARPNTTNNVSNFMKTLQSTYKRQRRQNTHDLLRANISFLYEKLNRLEARVDQATSKKEN